MKLAVAGSPPPPGMLTGLGAVSLPSMRQRETPRGAGSEPTKSESGGCTPLPPGHGAGSSEQLLPMTTGGAGGREHPAEDQLLSHLASHATWGRGWDSWDPISIVPSRFNHVPLFATP